MTKLSWTVIACISATMMLLGVAPIARADTIDDPLHGHCLAGCISNGTNTPIIGPLVGFYFQASPGHRRAGETKEKRKSFDFWRIFLFQFLELVAPHTAPPAGEIGGAPLATGCCAQCLVYFAIWLLGCYGDSADHARAFALKARTLSSAVIVYPPLEHHRHSPFLFRPSFAPARRLSSQRAIAPWRAAGWQAGLQPLPQLPFLFSL